MSHSCCGVARKSGKAAGWIIPGAVLALLPKCPLCIVGYVALIGGLGISITAATYLRIFLLVACTAWLTWMISRRVIRFVAKEPNP